MSIIVILLLTVGVGGHNHVILRYFRTSLIQCFNKDNSLSSCYSIFLTFNNLYKDCGIDQYLLCNFILYSMIVPVAVDTVVLLMMGVCVHRNL